MASTKLQQLINERTNCNVHGFKCSAHQASVPRMCFGDQYVTQGSRLPMLLGQAALSLSDIYILPREQVTSLLALANNFS